MKSEQEKDMLKPTIFALVRHALTVAGTAMVAKGYVEASDIEPVIGALLTIGSVIWSVAEKRNGKDSEPGQMGARNVSATPTTSCHY
jgi:hypothetical protein